jgi:RNA polymerase sigma factor (sigma-70 family)
VETTVDVERVVAGGAREHAGDILAVYDANQRDLFSFALAVTRDRGAAEDLVQEAFLRLVRETRAGRLPDQPRAWLYRVTVNLARTRARRAVVADRWRSLFRDRLSIISAEEQVVGREQRDLLRRALGHLPLDARTAFLLASDGHSGREIAGLIGKSEGATRTLLYRARRDLRRTIESEATR